MCAPPFSLFFSRVLLPCSDLYLRLDADERRIPPSSCLTSRLRLVIFHLLNPLARGIVTHPPHTLSTESSRTPLDTLSLLRHLMASIGRHLQVSSRVRGRLACGDWRFPKAGYFPQRRLDMGIESRHNAQLKLLYNSWPNSSRLACTKCAPAKPRPRASHRTPSHFLSAFPTFSCSSSRASSPAPCCSSACSKTPTAASPRLQVPQRRDDARSHVISECIVAGTDTTSISLS
ncbi:hypothetical protein B0H16DRAFT_737740 [Mycena metata]|uniref:Uncharacterized protein n=1 Tax=Mycena metata TaxID=1033252 RepID=A0AAD7NBH1_9AGAR|nr:hypothetical protein B0H16DRAFT_737740 [Mycena metata]